MNTNLSHTPAEPDHSSTARPPNIVFVFADQWRQQATGYNGDQNVQTPRLDALAAESIDFVHAISGTPVCSPYRASLMTGQHPLTHGVFLNDVPPAPGAVPIATAFANAGYDTAYVGKWHIDGHGRSSYIPPERRMGFDYWKVLECTHDYNHSPYFAGNDSTRRYWEDYDALAQTRDAMAYLRSRKPDKPFLLMLSWGPPHDPYDSAPEEFRRLYNPAKIELRPNVPDAMAEDARRWLVGYYAHCSALDHCLGSLLDCLDETGLARDTIFVFTSDHGDMLGSQGIERKQKPWDESIRVPFLLRWPGMPDWQPGSSEIFIDAPDIMPTLLGLCQLPVPATVEGRNLSTCISDGTLPPAAEAGLLSCVTPFGEWHRGRGGREYRGLRTVRYTYVRTLDGPWLLYDNLKDPYQLNNLVNDPTSAEFRLQLDQQLQQLLDDRDHEFLEGSAYISRWNYQVDATGTIPIRA